MEGILTTYPGSQLNLEGIPSPDTNTISSRLQLCNLTIENRVAFKVKSNAPKGVLVVRPNLGILSPKTVEEVQVSFHIPGNNNTDVKKNFKLKIQYVILTDGDVDLDWIWRSSPTDRIYDRKVDISVNFRSRTPTEIPPRRRLLALQNTHLAPLNDQQCIDRKEDWDDLLFDFWNLTPSQIYIMILIFLTGFILGKWII